MTIFAQLLVSGIAVGMIYGVIAFGYQLTFATSKTLNFGQGESLMLGALVIHGIQPGPMMLEARPDMFWGLVVSFGIGNLLLLILNLPLIGIWVSMLRIPFRWLYPAIIVFMCMGAWSVRGSSFDIVAVAAIGLGGYLLSLARFSPALLLLGFVLGPLIETNLRRAMLISRGDPMIFLERPIAAGFMLATVVLIAFSLWGAWRRKLVQD